MRKLNNYIMATIIVSILGVTASTYAVEPDAVQSLRSTSHVINTPSQNSIIQMSWRPPDNTTEIRGYYTLFSNEQFYTFSDVNTLNIPLIDALESVSTNYGEVDDMSIYFHIAATSTEDEIGETSSFGPIRIDTKAPTNPVLITDPNSTSRIVTLILGATNAIEMYLSNTAHGVGGQWEPMVSPKIWELTEGQGLKTIYVQFRDRADNRTKAMSTLNLDTIPPSVSISSQSQQETNQTEITIDILFSEPVENFIASDIFVNNCQIDRLDGADDQYSLIINPSGAGEFSVQIPENKANDVAGNGNESSETLVRIFDAVAPQISIASSTPNYTRDPAISVTVSFSEQIQSFTTQNIQTVNVLEITSFSQTGNDYAMTLIPENQGPVEMFIPENVSFDAAGNGNTLSESLVRYYDSVAPSIAITSNTRDTTNVSPIPMTITFNEKVKGFESTDIITYGTVTSFYSMDMENSYAQTFNFELIPPGQGEITVQIAENAAIDRAGNGNIASAPFVRIYDLTQPDILITTEVDYITNQSSVACTATFTSPVENLEPEDLMLTNAMLQGNINGSDTVFSFVIAPQNEGDVTIFIPEDTVFSKSGNTNRKSNEYSFTYDTLPPLFELESIENYASNQSPIPITLVCEEWIRDLNKSDIQTQGVSDIINFSVNENIAIFEVIPESTGLMTILVDANVFADLAGNPNTMTQSIQIEYDTTQPTVTLISSTSMEVSESPIPLTIIFSEPVTDFMLSDLSVTNAIPSNLKKINTQGNFEQTFSLDLVPIRQGEVFLTVPSDIAKDRSGNTNQASVAFQRMYSSDRPTVTISSSSPETTDMNLIPIEIVFSKSITGFDSNDIQVTNGVVDQFSGADDSFECIIKPAAQGIITVDIPENVATDNASLGNAAAAQLIRIYDYNDVPVAHDDSFSLNEDTSGTFFLTATDIDDSDILTYTLTTHPYEGIIFNAVSGEFTYTPEANFSGEVILTFVASDGVLESNTASVTITVLQINDSPTLMEPLMDQTIQEDALFEYNLPYAFVDIDINDTLSYTAQQTNGQALPSWLTFDSLGPLFFGTPTNNDVGQIHIKVKATDLSGTNISDTFSLTVVNVNDLPEIDIAQSLEMLENKSIQMSLTIMDVDSETLSLYAVTDNPSLIAYTNITFTGQGLLLNQDGTYTVLPGPSGSSQLTMSVSPQQNQFGTGQITLLLSDEMDTISSVVSANVQAVRFSLSGRVLYFKDAYPVQNVDVLLHGNATYESITDENGQYTFTNIPKGDYTIEASRKVDTLDDSISPMDASVIARSIVRLQELSCYELIAADVSRNGDTSAMDSSIVARYSAGLRSELNTDNTHWTFVSEPITDCSNWAVQINDYNIQYASTHTISSLQSDQSGLDFIALRLGDVTGNWPGNHTRKRHTSSRLDDSSVAPSFDDTIVSWSGNHRKRNYEPDNCDDTPITMPEIKVGETFQIPVILASSYTIDALELVIQSESNALRLIHADISQTIFANRGFQFLNNTIHMEGKDSFEFSYSGLESIKNSGVILMLTFEILDHVGLTPVSIEKFVITERLANNDAKEYKLEDIDGGFSFNDQLSCALNLLIYPSFHTTSDCLIESIKAIQACSTGQRDGLTRLIEHLKMCSGI
jgi:hypothetical protein